MIFYTQAKELHFVSEAPRAAFLVRQLGPADVSTIDVIQNLFPDKQTDFVISINETDVALIKQLPEGADARELQRIAKQIATAVTQELGIKVVIGHRHRGQPHPGSGPGLQGGRRGH